jgi:hypothetical protein
MEAGAVLESELVNKKDGHASEAATSPSIGAVAQNCETGSEQDANVKPN